MSWIKYTTYHGGRFDVVRHMHQIRRYVGNISFLYDTHLRHFKIGLTHVIIDHHLQKLHGVRFLVFNFVPTDTSARVFCRKGFHSRPQLYDDGRLVRCTFRNTPNDLHWIPYRAFILLFDIIWYEFLKWIRWTHRYINFNSDADASSMDIFPME